MDKILFKESCESVLDKALNKNGIIGYSTHIGTLSEKSVHAIVKHYLEPNTAYHEVKINNFYVDIINDHGITEIQTSNFDKLRKKLELLLDLHKITIVYPMAHIKKIYWIDNNTGEINPPRKSTKTGRPQDIFRELYKIKSFLDHPNLNLHIILMDMREYRLLDGWSKDRKKGATKCDRIPYELIDEIKIYSPNDYFKLIPNELESPFTVKDYKILSKISQRNASLAINILNHIGVIKRIGKKGRAYLYSR